MAVAVAGQLVVVLGGGDEGRRTVGAEIVPALRWAEHGVGGVGGFHRRETDGTGRSIGSIGIGSIGCIGS